MALTPELILQIIMAVGAPVAVYVGIKTDLATTHEKAITAKESADKAHARIDNILNKE
jgi:hypothetical protein